MGAFVGIGYREVFGALMYRYMRVCMNQSMFVVCVRFLDLRLLDGKQTK